MGRERKKDLRILRTTSSIVVWRKDLALIVAWILRTTSSIVEWNPDLALLLRILRTTSSTVEWNPDLALLLRILRTTSSGLVFISSNSCFLLLLLSNSFPCL